MPQTNECFVSCHRIFICAVQAELAEKELHHFAWNEENGVGSSPMVPGWAQPERTTWSLHGQSISYLKYNTFPKWWIKLTQLNDLTQFQRRLVVICCLQCYFVYSLYVLCCVINLLSETIRYCTWKWVLLFRLKETAIDSATYTRIRHKHNLYTHNIHIHLSGVHGVYQNLNMSNLCLYYLCLCCFYCYLWIYNMLYMCDILLTL